VGTSTAGAQIEGCGEWAQGQCPFLIFFKIGIAVVQFRAFLRVFKCLKPKLTESVKSKNVKKSFKTKKKFSRRAVSQNIAQT